MAGNMRTDSVAQQLCHAAREELRRLCTFTNQQLLDLMEQQLLAPPDVFDEELFDAAQALLDERAPIREEDAQGESFESFCQRHEEEFRSVGSIQEDIVPLERHPPKKRRRIFTRIVAILAAMVALFCLSAVASGKNPVTAVIDAGETLIRVVTLGPSGKLVISDGNTVGDYTSLDEALASLDIDNAKKIAWIPSEFSLSSVSVRDIPSVSGSRGTEVWAYYVSRENSIIYNITQYLHDGYSYISEKNPDDISTDNISVPYEIIRNENWIEFQWTDGWYSYSLAGDVAESILQNIFLSMK